MDFDAIESELTNIDILQNNYTRLDDETLYLTFLQTVGAAHIQLQTLEFLMLGVISHLNETLLKSEEKFKNLNPERFLSNTKEDEKYRKQTLGVIIKFLNKKIRIFDIEDLETFLINRNDFTHNFFRQYLSHKKSEQRDEIIKAANFALGVYKDSIKWTSIFKGFMYEIAIYIVKNSNRPKDKIEAFEHLKKHHETFLKSARLNNI